MFELTDGDVSRMESALAMPIRLALDWIHMQRERRRADLELRAALAGVPIKEQGKTQETQTAMSFAGLKGFRVKRKAKK